MICGRLFPNNLMVPAKIRRHLQTVHPDFKDKTSDFFYVKKNNLRKVRKNIMQTVQTSNEKATELSFFSLYRIARAGEAHTIVVNLMKPFVLDITKFMPENCGISFFNAAIKRYYFTSNSQFGKRCQTGIFQSFTKYKIRLANE